MVNRIRILPRASIGIVALTLALSAPSGGLAAQTDTMPPVLLVHGIKSDSTTWDETSAFLTQVAGFQRVRRTSTSYGSALGYQVGQLLGYSQSVGIDTASPILAAHSMGGLLARRLSWAFPVDAIVTIGTPHTGHSLLSGPNNSAVLFAQAFLLSSLTYSIIDWLSKCNEVRYDDEGEEVPGPCYDMFDVALTVLSIGTFLTITEDILIGGTSLEDLAPGSIFIAESVAGSGNELTTRKVALIGRLFPEEELISIYRNLFPQQEAAYLAALGAMTGGYLVYLSADLASGLSYNDPWFAEKTLASLNAGILGLLVAGLPAWWNAAIGGWPNDAFIPTLSQSFPGAATVDALGLSHPEETSSADIKLKLQELGSQLVRH